ncbi:MAG: DUF362 domain-containing protein [Deltaproteobacteria bacterium]|nr:DUF362 domain-containing protein [Deltaproteobacteria bacterium]
MPPPTPGARVVEVFRADSVVTDPKVALNPAAVRPMLDAALASLTDGAASPWSVLLPDCGPTARIGIKVNCLNQYLATSVPLVQALVASLMEGLGVEATRITVWDRRLDELTRAGFTGDALNGVSVSGTVSSTSDSSGPGYSKAICGVVAGKTPLLSRIITEQTDLTINVPVLKTHVVSGITAAFKNIYGIIDNPGDYHANANDALPALYALPPIRNHLRLTLVDALIAVLTGGTSDPPDAQPRRIILGQDPLAVDSYCLALANQLRAEFAQPPGDIDTSLLGWLDKAAEMGLGTRSYELVTVTQ